MATENILGTGELWRNGPAPGSLYQFPGHKPSQTSSQIGPAKRTMAPTVTGTSVLGLKFNGGVIIAADMLGSYGSLARYRNLSRLLKVNNSTVIGCGGDYADFQFLKSTITQRVIDEECWDDGFQYTPKSLFSWMTRVMYNRRSNFDPLWNTYVVSGMQDGEPFLGYVDKIGVAYEAPTVSSGYGSYIAQPLLRDAYEKNPNMTMAEAEQQIERCMKVLFYRDARSLNKYEVAVVTKDGAMVKSNVEAKANWEIAHLIKGYE
ncbi:proteasome subunit beta type-4-like [Pecten maximus]|uniref:proteasome subunit beta type-4-like n=1 Tax=Pecten maximus TaxID=6579 RepID=UPI001458635D|nr:proteasome subunit beta type-4-like [Pecten maximus]